MDILLEKWSSDKIKIFKRCMLYRLFKFFSRTWTDDSCTNLTKTLWKQFMKALLCEYYTVFKSKRMLLFSTQNLFGFIYVWYKSKRLIVFMVLQILLWYITRQTSVFQREGLAPQRSRSFICNARFECQT